MAFYTKVSCIVRTLVLRNFIFFLFQVWLLIGPKFSRKFIQRADVFTQYAFLPVFLKFVQNVWKANAGIFFWSTLRAWIFFSLNIPLHEFFFCTSPAHHNFSNGSTLTWRRSTRKSKQHNCLENQYMHLSSKKNLEIR